MAECIINGDSINRGIESLVDKELVRSKLFDKEGNFYVVKSAQLYDAQEFVGGINRKFSEPVIKNTGRKFSISIPEAVTIQYLKSTTEGQELLTTLGMYGESEISPASWNKDEPFTALNYPEISEFTYNQLIKFLKTINPKFEVEEVDNLTTDGLTLLKDFLISVKTMSKFKALPEEVAHVLIELIPDDHQLKKEMLANITSFEIYRKALAKYKDTYILPDGRPDYNKIKREASAQLVGEYITALSTDNFTKVDELTKPAAGFIKRWFYKLLEWLGINMLKTKSYADIAGIILSGETDISLKNEKDIADMNYTDSYFFRLSEEQRYKNAREILGKKPPGLLPVISKFSKEFGRRFNDILKDEKFKSLNDELKKSGNKVGKINRLSEIKILLKESRIDLRAAMDSDSFVMGFKQFLEAVDSLDILTDAILKVVKNKEESKNLEEATNSMRELEAYFGLYETFQNIISVEFAKILIKSGVASDVVESVQRTHVAFKNVNDELMERHAKDLFIFYKELLSKSNSVAAQTLTEDIEREQAKGKPNAKIIEEFKDKMKELVTTDDDIIGMLSGKGRDIDALSGLNHWVNAARLNGDPYLSSTARYIENNITVAQNKARVVVLNLNGAIDPIQKKLGEPAYVTGKFISFHDTIFDKDTGKPRKVLTWLNPHKNIQPDLEAHRDKIADLQEKWYDVDKNSAEFAAIDAQLRQARREYNNFLDKYMNRPYVREYYHFKNKYEDNPLFLKAMARWREWSDFIDYYEDELRLQPDDEVFRELSMIKRERANLLNEFDLRGVRKPDAELELVRILKAYFDESNKFMEEDEIQTELSFEVEQNRYEQKLDFVLEQADKKNFGDIAEVEKYLQENLKDPRLRLVNSYLEGTENDDIMDYPYIKDLLMKKWRSKNITIAKNEDFYEYEKSVREELKELQSKGELTETDLAIAEAYEERRNILFGSRDEIGQINPNSLSDEDKKRVIQLDNLIAELRKDNPSYLGPDVDSFSAEDRALWDEYLRIINDPKTSPKDRRNALKKRNEIAAQYKNTGKNETIKKLRNILGSLTTKTPSTYYWDRMSTFIYHMAEFGKYMRTFDPTAEEEKLISGFIDAFIKTVDAEDWDTLDTHLFERGIFHTDFLNWLKDSAPEQYAWFTENHSPKKVYDQKNNGYTQLRFARSSIYLNSDPVLEEHQKILYNRRFRRKRVKDEYRTGYNPKTKKVELVVGRHITNREYNGFPEFMPLLPEDGEPADSPYKNKEYYKLRDSKNPKDQLRWQYLQILRTADLHEQEKVPARLRRWNQTPVMSLSNVEDFANPRQIVKQKVDEIKSVFVKDNPKGPAGEDADAEAEAVGEDTTKQVDQFTQTTIMDRIPKLGMASKIPIERVSTDLLKSVGQMIFRAHEFESRTALQPVLKTLLRVMKDNEYNLQMSNKQRAEKFEKMYSQMILQEVPEGSVNSKAVRRFARFITSNTALRMIADPIGGMINYGSAMVNNLIEAAAGRYINYVDLAKGKYLAFRVNTALMADYNKKAGLSYYTLLFDTFDFIQGDFEEDLLDRSSSQDKHSSIRQLLMIPRKAGELLAQSAIAMAILDKNKVKNSIDEKEYSVHEIYQKTGNVLTLKKGFSEEEWNPVTGTQFLRIQELIHRINLELHGNYAKISQTEASRHALGKLAENMKRWFMPALQRRWGREGVDTTYELLTEGYYRTCARAAKNIFVSFIRLDFGGAQSWASMFWKTDRYRENIQRMAAEAAIATLLFLTFFFLLGYSGDDKNKELEQNSWIHNTLILISLRIFSETTSYIPFPALGFQEMKRNALAPFSLPADAVSNWAAIGQLGLSQVAYWMGWESLRDSLYYDKDAGYWYTEKGDSKLLKYILRTAGYTGYTFEPATYIQQFDNLQKRLK